MKPKAFESNLQYGDDRGNLTPKRRQYEPNNPESCDLGFSGSSILQTLRKKWKEITGGVLLKKK